MRLASSSNGSSHGTATLGFPRPLSSLAAGVVGHVIEVGGDTNGRGDRLLALGVTAGASITVLQTFPGVVFLCDQTELAVERGVADAIMVRVVETCR